MTARAMVANLPDFGSFELGHERRPGPIRTLVGQMVWDFPTDGVSMALAISVADKIDQAIAEAAQAVRQLGEDEERYGADWLRKVVVVTTLGGIHELDEVVELAEALSPFGCEHYGDAAWNFRNGIAPFKPGDPLYLDEDGERIDAE